MTSPARKVAEYLELNGVGQIGGTGQWNISVSQESLGKDVITVIDTGGAALDTDDLDDLPTIQVRVRSGEYLAGWGKQNQIVALLTVPAPINLNGEVRLGCALVSGPIDLGKDDASRFLSVVNYQLERKA